MSDLQELYQSVILDHNRKPRYFGALDGANRAADGKNPLCGDEVHVALHVENDIITDVKFTGHGCAISKASASLMTSEATGMSVIEFESFANGFRDAMRSRGTIALSEDEYGDLAALSGVSKFVARVKCAMLAWVAAEDSLILTRESLN